MNPPFIQCVDFKRLLIRCWMMTSCQYSIQNNMLYIYRVFWYESGSIENFPSLNIVTVSRFNSTRSARPGILLYNKTRDMLKQFIKTFEMLYLYTVYTDKKERGARSRGGGGGGEKRRRSKRRKGFNLYLKRGGGERWGRRGLYHDISSRTTAANTKAASAAAAAAIAAGLNRAP